MIYGPATSASPEALIEIPILTPFADFTESETLWVGGAQQFEQALWLLCNLKFEKKVVII